MATVDVKGLTETLTLIALFARAAKIGFTKIAQSDKHSNMPVMLLDE